MDAIFTKSDYLHVQALSMAIGSFRKYKKVISHETLTTSEESPLVSLPDATPVISSKTITY
jgi:hypothetical protein